MIKINPDAIIDNSIVRVKLTQDVLDEITCKANKDGYYDSLSAGYADKAGDIDIHTYTTVHHIQTKFMETTGGEDDVKDGVGFVRSVKGTESGITSNGAKIISLGFNLIQPGSGTTFTFKCVRGEWGTYGTSDKNNGYLFTNSDGDILIPVSVKQNGAEVPTHTDHNNTYYLPPLDGQCTVVFGTTQTNPCAHLCWSNGRDLKDNYEPYNASQIDLSTAIAAIGGTLRRVGYVLDEINFETKQSIRRVGRRQLSALLWTMEAGPISEEGESINIFRANVTGGILTTDIIKNGGAFVIKGTSGLVFSLDRTSILCESSISSISDFITAIGDDAIEYELAEPVLVANALNSEIIISDYGITIFENGDAASTVDINFDFYTKWVDFIKNLPNNINTTDQVLAESLVNLNERISNIESMIENGFPTLTVQDIAITRALFTKIALGNAFTNKAGTPTTIPDGVLQFYRNTTDGSIYISVGSDSISDWIKIT